MVRPLMLFALLVCCGCSEKPQADVTLNILPDAAQIVRLKVSFDNADFDVPPDHVDAVLAALQPEATIKETSKCEVIAHVGIESKDAPPLELTVHTRNHPAEFAAHSVGVTDHHVNYRGRDAARLEKVLKAARDAAQQTNSRPHAIALGDLSLTGPLVVRTNFEHSVRWMQVCDDIKNSQLLQQFVTFYDNASQQDRTALQVVQALPDNYPFSFCMVADKETMGRDDLAILVIGFYPADPKQPRKLPRDLQAADITTFRALPSRGWDIVSNLTPGTLSFADYAAAAQKEGVYQGFE